MGPEFQVVPARPEHLISMQGRVRQADIDEFWAAAHSHPIPSCIASLRMSTVSWAATWKGEVICVGGVIPIDGIGIPWMIGTNDLDRVAMRFLRRCGGVMQKVLEQFPTLVNFVDARNIRAISWLKWMGFTIHPAEPHGVDGLPFHRFTWSR